MAKKKEKKDVEQEMKDKRDAEMAEVIDEFVTKSSMKEDREKYVTALKDISTKLEQVEEAKQQLLTNANRIQGAVAYIDAQCSDGPRDDVPAQEETEDGKSDTPKDGAEAEAPAGGDEGSEAGPE